MSKKLKVRILFNQLLVRPIPEDEKTPGGIIIPETAREKTQRGEIVALGNGRNKKTGKIRPIDAKIGDIVFFTKFKRKTMVIENIEYWVLVEKDIFGFLET